MIFNTTAQTNTRGKHILYLFLAGLNVITAITGFLFLANPSFWLAGKVFGYLFVSTTVCNSAACAFDRRTGLFSIAYLLFTAVGFLFLPLVLLVRASFVFNAVSTFSSCLIVFGSLGFGVLVGINVFPRGSSRWIARPAAATSALAAGFLALAITIRFLAGPHPRTAGVLVPQCLPYWSMSFLTASALSARFFYQRERTFGGAFLAGLPALAAAILAFLPVCQVPGIIRTADAGFLKTFGVSAESIQAPGLKRAPFSLGQMFLGSKPGRAVSRLNVPYHSETVEDGRSYTFKFDHWSPAEPGPHPVLIRIHGGAWISGDKGYGNMNNMNRHFASLGYSVFDIQYGLNETASFSVRSPTPPSVLGPFRIEDMVRHLGEFSAYLADHARELDADLDRVFVSGGSAGGHLTLAVALAQTSGYIREHPGVGLDPRLTIRGLIPFYPAVGYPIGMGIPCGLAMDDFLPLLGADNPPALIYQGVLDGMVDIDRVRAFVGDYNAAGGGPAALVAFPTAGHGSDLIFWNCYNQVFLYYMERFMVMEAR